MSISDRLRDDSAYIATFLQLVRQEAESTRLNAEELREAGFAPVQVRGLSSVVWQREEELYTTEEALNEVMLTTNNPKEEA
jgi:hypothetical protein